jgi:Protein of unknown function (DUF559)
VNEGGCSPSAQRLRFPLPFAGEGWGEGDDFVCPAAHLPIKRDGGQRISDEGGRADGRPSAVIEAKGFQLFRFNNRDRMINRAGGTEIIATAVAASPILTLPRKPERGPPPDAGNQNQ